MGNSWFQFQQFRIHQDRCAMKVSTDAVLLGALAEAESTSTILDIGTGTGVISLMLAQRFGNSAICAVELDQEAAEQATENFRGSPFSERLEVFNIPFQKFPENRTFDLIVSNPPFFRDHLKSKDSKRNQALHTDALSFEDLIAKAVRLLNEDGKIWIILPPRQMNDFEKLAKNSGLFPQINNIVRDTETKPIIRQIKCFSKNQTPILNRSISIKKPDGSFSNDYLALISGFLLGY